MNFIPTILSSPTNPSLTPLTQTPVRVIEKDTEGKLLSKTFRFIDSNGKESSLTYRKPEKSQLLGKGTYKKVFEGSLVHPQDQTSRIAHIVTTLDPEHKSYEAYLNVVQRELRIMDQLSGAQNVLQKLANFAYEGSRGKKKCEKYIIITPAADCSLQDYFAQNPVIEELARYQIFKGTLTGLAEMHRRGVIHLDIKNGNILLTFNQNGIHASLCDFGLSRIWKEIQDPSIKQKVMRLSSYPYMSPEQFFVVAHSNTLEDIAKIQLNRDVWALGLIFYRIYRGIPHPLHDAIKYITDLAERREKITYEIQNLQKTISVDGTDKKLSEIKEEHKKINKQYDQAHQSIANYIKDMPQVHEKISAKNSLEALIKKMIHPLPEKRISAEEALKELIDIGKELGFET